MKRAREVLLVFRCLVDFLRLNELRLESKAMCRYWKEWDAASQSEGHSQIWAKDVWSFSWLQTMKIFRFLTCST